MEDWRYAELYELEDQHWWFRSRRSVLWALLRRAGMPESPRILDAGCGTGRNLAEFAALGEAEGVDFSEEAVAFCHRRGLTGVRRALLEELPFEDARFDLLLATDVVEHVDDDRRVLTELRRVAAPGARLVLTVPAYTWLWSQHDVSMHHRRRYTLGRLDEQVARDRVGADGRDVLLQHHPPGRGGDPDHPPPAGVDERALRPQAHAGARRPPARAARSRVRRSSSSAASSCRPACRSAWS